MNKEFIQILIVLLIAIYCIVKLYEIYINRKFIGKNSKKDGKPAKRKKLNSVVQLKSSKKKEKSVFHNISAKSIGKNGENKVKHILEELSSGYIVINDLMIETNIGTNQIDHVVVCSKGIFIIETKNYTGDIYGKEDEKYWTQHLTYNNVKNKFYNPIWQNNGHISAVKYKLNGIISCDIVSIVCFDERCTLKKIKSNVPVIYFGELKKYIKSYKTDNKLTKKQVEEISVILKSSNIRGIGKRKAHSKYVEKRQKV